MDRSVSKILKMSIETLQCKTDLYGICDYCQVDTELIRFGSVITANTKEHNLFTGKGFCKNCYSVLKFSNFRKKSFVFEGGNLHYPLFTETYDYAFKELEYPNFLSFLPLLAQKNNVFYGRVNYYGNKRFVVFDRELIEIDLVGDKKYADAFTELYIDLKQTKKAIEDRTFSYTKLSDIEIKRLKELDKLLNDIRGTFLYRFLFYYLSKKKEIPNGLQHNL